MATHLDLDEQEQLDQLKAFWTRHGTWITWLVIAALGAYAAWNGWNWWQRDQAGKSGAMFDQLESAAQAGDADQSARIFGDMKDRFARTAFTEQAGLVAAKVQVEKGQTDAALVSLAWVADNAAEVEYRSIARLRAAGILLDQKKYPEALKQLDAVSSKDGGSKDGGNGFVALADDRRGDVLMAQGKPEDAKAAYGKAWQAMDPKVDYRRLVEAKLTALGVPPSGADKAVGAAS